ncbi:GGDEF domain-containing protein [Paenibacillus turpanensis]|uniref:GGDEF domain-containing protein n=1 Tax=Paenibacillus turpanensis TaxID=2689078 RepID=UPI00140E8CDF|nr:GGDEF domain-containing protein [Paenibacillus turpanensis]
MTFAHFVTGPMGRFFTDSCIIIMLLLIGTMSVRLMMSRGKLAYRTLTLSLALMIISYLISIFFIVSGSGGNKDIFEAMQMIAFLFANMGIYQLYNPTRKLQRFLFTFALLVSIAMIVLHFYWKGASPSADNQALMMIDMLFEIYMFVLLFGCFLFVSPNIGQSHKYQIGLTAFFVAHGAFMLNKYITDGKSLFFATVELFLPFIYFFMLFLLVFDRVVELMQAVYKSSITDGLTGIYNRTFFIRQVTRYVQANRKVAVIFCDIDNFKKLNDTQGHQKGDEALKHVANIVNEESEEIGIAGRYGGEEIVMLITEPGVKPEDAAERVRSRIEAEAGVTVSVGFSKYRKGITSEQLLKEADEAMYVSKTTGKNKVTRYAPKMMTMGL